MHVDRFEKAFLILSGAMLVTFLGALFYSAWGMGRMLPDREGEIIPAQVRQTPPFDNPGVRQVGPNHYEAVIVSQAWAFQPGEIRIPAGSRVDFITTTVDVIHGFEIEGALVNAMVLPGQITRVSYTFEEPGEHLIICHEYCGSGHHAMFGKVIVE